MFIHLLWHAGPGTSLKQPTSASIGGPSPAVRPVSQAGRPLSGFVRPGRCYHSTQIKKTLVNSLFTYSINMVDLIWSMFLFTYPCWRHTVWTTRHHGASSENTKNRPDSPPCNQCQWEICATWDGKLFPRNCIRNAKMIFIVFIC